MKSAILIACLIVSAVAAPQKTAGLERESSEKKNEKLQFEAADSQYYTGAVVPETVVPDQTIPSYYYESGVAAVPAVSSVVSGVVPYSSSIGRTTLTTATSPATGLPIGHVYEHHGTSHIGHLASTVHVRRPAHLFTNPLVNYASPFLNTAAGIAHGQVQYINGQPAQYINGQWYYLNSQLPALHQGVYANPLNRPVYQTIAGKTYVQQYQPGTYSSVVTGAVRPAVQDSRWYTKTNTQQVAAPFYGQPQYYSGASGIKSQVAPRHEVASVSSQSERSDW